MSSVVRRVLAAVTTALLTLYPAVVHACPVCFDAKDEARGAYLATTGLLTLLPLLLIGGIVLVVARRARRPPRDRR